MPKKVSKELRVQTKGKDSLVVKGSLTAPGVMSYDIQIHFYDFGSVEIEKEVEADWQTIAAAVNADGELTPDEFSDAVVAYLRAVTPRMKAHAAAAGLPV